MGETMVNKGVPEVRTAEKGGLTDVELLTDFERNNWLYSILEIEEGNKIARFQTIRSAIQTIKENTVFTSVN